MSSYQPKSYKIRTEKFHRVVMELHKSDWEALKKLLIADEITFKKFFMICVDAYICGDAKMLKLVNDAIALKEPSKEEVQKYMFSQRERKQLLLDLEKQNGSTKKTSKNDEQEDLSSADEPMEPR